MFFIRGVTGSGKTEVYLQIIQEVLNMGNGYYVGSWDFLTPQMTDHFISFDIMAPVLGLSNGEKYDQWRKVERGEARGSRELMLAPCSFKNIGATTHEEHEASYKQDSNPRYHAAVAVLRAQYNQAVLSLDLPHQV